MKYHQPPANSPLAKVMSHVKDRGDLTPPRVASFLVRIDRMQEEQQKLKARFEMEMQDLIRDELYCRTYLAERLKNASVISTGIVDSEGETIYTFG